MRRYYALCRDAVTGMEFDFELESTSRKAAREEAHCKYNGVVFVGARAVKAGGGGAEPQWEDASKQSAVATATSEDQSSGPRALGAVPPIVRLCSGGEPL